MDIEEKYLTLRIQFMHSILNLLPFSEWSEKLVDEAAIACSFEPGYHYVLFPQGLSEIIEYFEEWQDIRMLEILSKCTAPSKIREKILLALKIRIKECGPKLIHIKNGAYFAVPANIISATKLSFRTCDVIWHYAGDKSTDYNYYTKRSLLLSAYLSAIMYYINDESEDYANTDIFIAEALDNIINISLKLKNILKRPDISNIPFLRLFSK